MTWRTYQPWPTLPSSSNRPQRPQCLPRRRPRRRSCLATWSSGTPQRRSALWRGRRTKHRRPLRSDRGLTAPTPALTLPPTSRRPTRRPRRTRRRPRERCHLSPQQTTAPRRRPTFLPHALAMRRRPCQPRLAPRPPTRANRTAPWPRTRRRHRLVTATRHLWCPRRTFLPRALATRRRRCRPSPRPLPGMRARRCAPRGRATRRL
mmetsp:Transcript_55189/g.153806  ORF Transcript_55189/g.153806 Transcript_55189/m.153806 type:complete len:206 (+) Transcript_55189:653-1270(+)